MKRFLNLFLLTTAEQRVVIVLVLLVVLGAWAKHRRDIQYSAPPPPAPTASPSPQGAAVYKPPTP